MKPNYPAIILAFFLGFMTAAIADMDAVWCQRAAECPPDKRSNRTALGRTFCDDCDPAQKQLGITRAMLLGDLPLDRADMSLMIDVPQGRLGGGADRRGAMACHESLGRHVLELAHENALAIRLQATLDFIDDGDGRLALILLGDRQGGEAPRAGAPTCQRQRHGPALRGQPNHRRDRSALPAGDLEIETAGKTAHSERLIEVGERRFGAIGEFILDGVVGQGTRHPRSQSLVGEQPVERGTLHEAQIPIIAIVAAKPN